jgi:hypothetical protein
MGSKFIRRVGAEDTFAREHEFTALVMDCGPRRYLAAISLRGESDNLESRIERVSGMYFLEKLAGSLG